jgi:hypothetical protein
MESKKHQKGTDGSPDASTNGWGRHKKGVNPSGYPISTGYWTGAGFALTHTKNDGSEGRRATFAPANVPQS